MPQTLEWEPFCPNEAQTPKRLIPVLSFLIDCPQRRETMAWVIASCWRSGCIGWRDPKFLSQCGQIIKPCLPAFSQTPEFLKGQVGPVFFLALLSLIVLAQAISSPTHSPTSSHPVLVTQILKPFCSPPVYL